MCEFCTFGLGRMFNIHYQGGFCDFDKLDISMGKPYLTKVRKGRQLLRKVVYECPRCGRKLTQPSTEKEAPMPCNGKKTGGKKPPKK